MLESRKISLLSEAVRHEPEHQGREFWRNFWSEIVHLGWSGVWWISSWLFGGAKISQQKNLFLLFLFSFGKQVKRPSHDTGNKVRNKRHNPQGFKRHKGRPDDISHSSTAGTELPFTEKAINVPKSITHNTHVIIPYHLIALRASPSAVNDGFPERKASLRKAKLTVQQHATKAFLSQT